MLTFTVLLSFFTASTGVYISWLLEDQTECVEQGESEKEGEEKEAQQKKEKESYNDRCQNDNQFAMRYAFKQTITFSSYYFWNHYLEVPTPPPEVIQFFSNKDMF
ncbi:MAG: hypothetical protein AAFP82_06735 [Bacteroidota bacterium]